LLKGEAVSEAIVGQMIDEKINSPECLHHGVLLTLFNMFLIFLIR
jgi:hypothetical protein